MRRRAEMVGRAPWYARDALVPLPERLHPRHAKCEQADEGVGRGPGGPPHRIGTNMQQWVVWPGRQAGRTVLP